MTIRGGLAACTLLIGLGAGDALAQHGEVATVMALRGELIDGSVDFHGVTVQTNARAGAVHAARSDGVSCRGRYSYGEDSTTSGDGRFICGRGQAGLFWFVRDGDSVFGCGVLDERAPFRFVAGAAAFMSGYPQGFDCGTN